jgi:glycosidase
MAFDFAYGFSWDGSFAGASAQPLADHFSSVQEALPPGAQSALFVGSHDVPRAFARADGIASRWRRAALVQMTMPGTPFVYYGEELALRPGSQVVVDRRDSARTPMLWDAPPLPWLVPTGFGWGFTTGQPWIAFGADPERTNLEYQRADPHGDYAFYRSLLGLRRGREAFGAGTLRILATDEPSVLLYVRESADETYVVAVGMDEGDGHAALAPAASLPGDPQRLFGDASLARDGDSARVAMPPAGMGIFRVR